MELPVRFAKPAVSHQGITWRMTHEKLGLKPIPRHADAHGLQLADLVFPFFFFFFFCCDSRPPGSNTRHLWLLGRQPFHRSRPAGGLWRDRDHPGRSGFVERRHILVFGRASPALISHVILEKKAPAGLEARVRARIFLKERLTQGRGSYPICSGERTLRDFLSPEMMLR